MPANEHFSMQLARQVFGIETAACALLFFNDDDSPAYLTRRFDVLSDGTRLLLEDFAQIARRSEATHGKNYKYDACYEEIAGCMNQYVSAYTIEVEKFYKQLLFDYLIHNGDAHLKNFSLCRDPVQNTYVLTPAYDLLNTRLHLPHESIMALQLFKNDYQTESFQRNGFYARDDFYEFGIRIGITPQRTNRFLDTIVARSKEVGGLLARSLLSEEFKVKYGDMVADRAKALSYSYLNSQTR
jgi:serine/threonine-protein kinase HipA